MARLAPIIIVALVLSAPRAALGQEQTLTFDGEVPDGGARHFRIPFTVPEGVVEIEVRHDDLSEANILDWGLYDPAGSRGWGGGNDEPAVVGINAASRSYTPGAIANGEWSVIVGKAKIVETPALYHVEVVLRDVATLAAQPERTAYAPPAPLSGDARWYAGDFHVHSIESGDARPPLEEILDYARGKGLDFIEISDHNTHTQLDFYDGAQAASTDVLLLPGVEFTTYQGHANGIGATQWVDHKIGFEGATIEAAAEAYNAQDALLSINHPVLDIGDLCIGCAWAHELDLSFISAVEIGTGGWQQSGFLFGERAIAYWDELCDSGQHVAAIGGSDDHSASVDLGMFESPIGDPTTMVYASELGVDAILDAIRNSRTVVKLQGPDDPMIELSTDVAPVGDTVSAGYVVVRAKVSGGDGATVRFVQDGAPLDGAVVVGDEHVHELALVPPTEGETRVRAEVLVNDKPRTVTSHVWLKTGPGGPPPAMLGEDDGCGCRLAGAGDGKRHDRWRLFALMLFAFAAAVRRISCAPTSWRARRRSHHQAFR
jgi:hypothetical protein